VNLEETMSSLIVRAAARLTELGQDAAPGPWTVTSKSGVYGAVVSTGSQEATETEIDGYGGEVIGESMRARNQRFVIAMRGVADPLAEILRDEARDWEDSEELVLPEHPLARMCLAILGEDDR
jgi:hypothetical protein